MRKKHWIIGLIALLTVMVGVGSGTALAQENREEGDRPNQGVISRVAIILGLEEQQVQDAFDQARQELRDERFEEMVGQRLDALVASGRITQEQADELREWYASRPDSFWLAAGSDRGKDASRHKGRQFGARGRGSQIEQLKSAKFRVDGGFGMYVSGLLEKGLITQEQADEIRGMYAAEPRGFAFGRDNIRGQGFGQHWGQVSRGTGHTLFGGHNLFRGDCTEKGKTAPAKLTPEAPAATPTAPAETSDDN